MWNLVQTSLSRMFYNYDFLCHIITKGENITCKSLKFCFVFAAKTHAVSLSIGSACRSIFLQTSHCLVGSSCELYPRVLQTIISIYVCFSDVFQRNYFIFFHYSNTSPPLPRLQKKHGLQTCRSPFWIYSICFSLRHIAVATLGLLALWYWCNMLIQLLSFKYDICHKEFEPKISCSKLKCNFIMFTFITTATPHGQLRMRVVPFYELWKPYRSLLREDPCIHYWNYF